MYHLLENEELRIKINSSGCELHSIFDKRSGRELLWQADPMIWPKHGPVLFPVIGRLRGGAYEYGGRTYRMPPHGFASQREFAHANGGAGRLSLVLRSDAETRAVYPFEFNFTLTFKLAGRKLLKTHTIENLSDQEMLFEVGGHEGYTLFYEQKENMGQYSLEFSGKKPVSYDLDKDLMICSTLFDLPLKDGRLFLNKDTFTVDTFIIPDQSGGHVTLISDKARPVLRVQAGDFSYIGIWTKKLEGSDIRFVCIEPWSSLPDCSFVSERLEDKSNVQRLTGKESREYSYAIEIV